MKSVNVEMSDDAPEFEVQQLINAGTDAVRLHVNGKPTDGMDGFPGLLAIAKDVLHGHQHGYTKLCMSVHIELELVRVDGRACVKPIHLNVHEMTTDHGPRIALVRND